ncbi:PAS domain S-box protein [Brevundimonas sp.]|uniref:PAS domain S-box protein n=1 Tax=Brevundimonas sp. TaxID=1871086 RepID=UPI002FC6C9CF
MTRRNISRQVERARVDTVRHLRILDTPPELRFDRLTRLAADIFNAPIALVSLVDEDRQRFKSRQGMNPPETGRGDLFFGHAVNEPPGGLLIVPDATRDPRFADSALVKGADGLRFYAGAVLTTPSGHNVGTLCIRDRAPRTFSDVDARRLRELADLVTEQIELARERSVARDTRRLLDLVEAVSRVGHWRLEVDTGEVTWSDEVYRIFGFPTDQPLSRDAVAAVYAPEDRARRDAMMRRVIEDGGEEAFEATIVRPDGERCRVVASALRELDSDGRVDAVFGVVQDITERYTAMERMARSEARYRLLATHMDDVITRLRPDGRSSYISPAVKSLLGYRPSEMAGRPAQDFVHPDDRPELLKAFRKLSGSLRRCTLQQRALRKDGTSVWVETSFQAVKDDAGKTLEITAVIRDHSVQHRLEEDLREARDRAEAGSEAKSRFLSNMSHELRTPLTSVIGFSRILQARDGLGPVERQCADRILLSGEVLLAVINDILDYSKLEAGAVSLERRLFDLRTVLREAAEIVLGQIEEKGLWYAQDIADTVPHALLGDPGRLRQVLLNFLGNAAKFTRRGGVSVAVGATPLGKDQVQIRIAVSDTGVGVEPEAAKALFERFVQADQSTSRRFGGTGLGLAISRELVELMGGRVGMESIPGQGSTFWFEVPLDVPE